VDTDDDDDDDYRWIVNTSVHNNPPVPGDLLVKIEYNNGMRTTCKANEREWAVGSGLFDIKRYRLVDIK
jgi:hypothetical protein